MITSNLYFFFLCLKLLIKRKVGQREGDPVFEANLAALKESLVGGYDAGGKSFEDKKRNKGKEEFRDD